MNSADFWTSVKNIIDDGFTSEGLQNLIIAQNFLLEGGLYINDFHRRNSMAAQRGGAVHVIASLLAGAENCPDSELEGREEFKRELKYAEKQARAIEKYFSETSMRVLGFGRDSNDEFKIIVEQPFIQGLRMSDEEIETFMSNMGFVLMNRKNWTYATPYIYLSDMHDENVMRSENGTVFVVDCDIRINTPKLRHSGVRVLSNNVIIDM